MKKLIAIAVLSALVACHNTTTVEVLTEDTTATIKDSLMVQTIDTTKVDSIK